MEPVYFGHVRPVTIQISLRIRTVLSESSPGACLIPNDVMFLHAKNKDSDQTVRMRRLIWVFVVCTSEGTFSQVEDNHDVCG